MQRSMVAVRTCPECGSRLGSGTLGFVTYLGGPRWYRKRTTLALGGQNVVPKPLGGMVWIDGFRCEKCRLLLLHY